MRPLTTLAFALAVLVASAWAAATLRGAKAVSEGARAYRHRGLLGQVRRTHTDRPLVVWLGDSTIMANLEGGPYPDVVSRAIGADTPMESLVIATQGLTFYQTYFLMRDVLELQPALVVAVANVRSLHPSVAIDVRSDLASALHPRDLPAAMQLPFAEAGISLARLVLYQGLRCEAVERALYFFTGLRALARDTWWGRWVLLDPVLPAPLQRVVLAQTMGSRQDAVTAYWFRAFSFEVVPANPILRMMAATVRMASHAGVPVIVVGNPLPRGMLRDGGGYDEPRTARSYAVIRDAVHAAGGTFLDLHASLEDADFSDRWGHLGVTGVQRMTVILEPLVRAALASSR